MLFEAPLVPRPRRLPIRVRTAIAAGLIAGGGAAVTTTPALAASLPTGVGVPWATTVSGTGADWSTAVASGPDGSSVVVGNVDSPTAAFGATTLTRAGASGTDAFATGVTERGAFQWATRVGGAGADEATGVATLPDGSSVMVGKFVGAASFGSTTLTGGGGSTGWDAFVTKLTPTGSVAWAIPGTTGAVGQKAGARAVAALADGSTIVVGEFNGQMTLGSTTLTSTGGWDVFIARVMPGGTVAWAIPGGSPTGDDGAYGVSALPAGGVVVTGLFTGTMTLGGRVLGSAGDKDAWVAKVTAGGSVAWATSAGGTGADWGMGVSALDDGSSVVTGFFSSTPARFGGTALETAGGNDIFVAKVTPRGQFAWAIRGGGTGTDRGQAVATQPDGSATVTGYYSGTGSATFGGTPMPAGSGSGVLVARVQPNGQVAWATGTGGAGTNRGTGVTSASNASTTVVGFFAQEVAFGAASLVGRSGTNPFVANYRTPCEGNFIQDDLRRLAFDPDRGVYLVRAQLTVASNPARACRVRTTMILRDPVTGKRIVQLAGSVVGNTRLGAPSGAPSIPWPGAKGVNVTLSSVVRRTGAVTPAIMRRAHVLVVRRIATDPLQPVSATNPRIAYADAFTRLSEWAIEK